MYVSSYCCLSYFNINSVILCSMYVIYCVYFYSSSVPFLMERCTFHLNQCFSRHKLLKVQNVTLATLVIFLSS